MQIKKWFLLICLFVVCPPVFADAVQPLLNISRDYPVTDGELEISHGIFLTYLGQEKAFITQKLKDHIFVANIGYSENESEILSISKLNIPQNNVYYVRSSKRDPAFFNSALYLFTQNKVSGYAISESIFYRESKAEVFQPITQLPEIPYVSPRLTIPPNDSLKFYGTTHHGYREIYALATINQTKFMLFQAFYPLALEQTIQDLMVEPIQKKINDLSQSWGE